ncbi:MAG TPA: 50S ribosomal protein L28 [Peptococcaceae bacterium]|jgi:large subunit ribosomal protein L28|nr:50S ribosomal protein L28 [Clostridia bacterium]HOB81959.1 50S ribosomal protein L28 [Peptococcaceae bacterium]HPZ71967.1 50S ribosomal protein L28 [Peptococcaceae bacterium]HQD53277.1 50S ribosomal protein L28 [Peptococcaceae bacterium]
MANRCAVCGKGKSTGMQVSHSHIRTKKTWAPNLQPVKAIIDGTTRRIKVCTRCLRSGKVTRAN